MGGLLRPDALDEMPAVKGWLKHSDETVSIINDKEIEPIGAEEIDPFSITRPDESLLKYYFLVSACSLIAFPIVFIPLYIRYRTLRYRFDAEGVSMSWGLLFHNEVYLTYRRVQDIHVTRNLIERWLGLAKVPIQTASGTSGATMKIEGIVQAEVLRDFLYERMRGARSEQSDGEGLSTAQPLDATLLLREIRDALLESRKRD